jgi:YfiR/HmsC-like
VSPLRAFAVEDVVLLARSSQITTLTGVPRYVETGCAIGLDLKGDRPHILINLAASRAEGADLNAQLLKLARLVGDRTGL